VLRTVRIDVHQHLLPEPLIAALGRRAQAPRVRRASEGLLLEVAGEPPSLLDPSQHDPHLRARRAGADGLDRALISLSTVLGIEALPPDEGAELLAAWEDGVRDLPPALGHWGAVSLTEIDPAAVDRQLDGGAAGISLPAGALTTDAGLDRLLPLLGCLQRREAALFVHPGPDPWSPPPATATRIPWLPALTRYVAEMNGAWHSFATLRHRLLTSGWCSRCSPASPHCTSSGSTLGAGQRAQCSTPTRSTTRPPTARAPCAPSPTSSATSSWPSAPTTRS
jgi:6-methylsalicylate decarboxylase